ncbi:PAS domain-containing sensor histidine kinase [Natrinema salsiterrestre]|uniref:histidine kinase n=1 Tax=Natrinema salsiterrestre TaxID=2950540 RepID=A0A9Q4L255_9EURY|nr:PAS domain-containing sensor histidine kinase [Natrinema salsiterrestre]MDF9745984.1 PAS domain-containing sensor histidine kinase [Natrinema salsiterrestre]
MEIGELTPFLLEYTQDKIAVVDEELQYVYVNEASEAILGYEPDQLIGQSARDYVHPDDERTVAAQFRAIGSSDEPSATVRYRHATSDGEWVWLESRFTDFPDDTLEGYVVSSRDISEQVAAERDRRDAESRLRTIAGTVGDVLWMFSGDWSELLFVNPAYEDVFGRPVEALREDPTQFLEVVHPDDIDCVREAMERASSGESVDIEYRVNPEADYSRWVWVRSEPIVEDGEVVRIVGFSRDITDRRRRERQLAVMDKLLRHNLRNDMAVILGNAECIASEASDPARGRAEIIQQQGRDLLESTDKQREIIDLLTGNTVPSAVDLVPFVTDAIETIRDRYPNATIETTMPESATATALHEVELAITELLENAVRHAADGHPELSVTVRSGPETVDIEIRDDCPPIPEVEFRVLTGDWGMDDVYHTSGLGLWLVYWVVDLSDGHVSFDRSETGNVITVSLKRDRS